MRKYSDRYPNHRLTDKEFFEKHFWSKVDKKGHKSKYTKECCWIWLGTLRSGRYGSTSFRIEGAMIHGSHRVAYRLANGEIPDGQCVRHICHEMRCVRPSHLKVGTAAENSMDSLLDERFSTKLNKETLPQLIKDLVARQALEERIKVGDLSLKAIAARYNIAVATIYNITINGHWAKIIETLGLQTELQTYIEKTRRGLDA